MFALSFIRILISLTQFLYFVCSILYLKSVGNLWLSPPGLFAGLFGFPYPWNNFCLPFLLFIEQPALLNFMFSLDFFHMKLYVPIIWVYKSLLSSRPLILFYYFTTFPSGLNHFMVRLSKFTPLSTGIRLNQSLLSFLVDCLILRKKTSVSCKTQQHNKTFSQPLRNLLQLLLTIPAPIKQWFRVSLEGIVSWFLQIEMQENRK